MNYFRLLRASAGHAVHSRGGVATGEQRHAPRFSRRRLWHFAAEYLLLLPAGAAVALVWANVAPESYFRTVFAIDTIVTDIAMALFFGLMAKEVVEATAPGGVLHPWRRVAFPLVASVGMTVVPALLYAGAVAELGEPVMRPGWPVTFATDLALVYFFARIIFGRHPAIPFLLLLTISADALGFVVLATTAHQLRLTVAVPLMVAALGAAAAFRRARMKSFWPYILVGGTLSWCALYFGGFHPALALVPIVPFLPHARRDPGFFVDAPPDAHDTLNRFELWCRHPAQVALLLFGIVSAGVPLRALEAGTWGLPLATLVGKPVGLLLGSAVALLLGLHLPRQVGWPHLVVLGFLGAIGFTIALYFAAASIGPGPVLSQLKMGALLSLAGALPAFAAAWLLKVGRFAR
jgi:NhaA family Na+:H+ antiporter